MNIGWVGLGKLGLPCALVLAQVHGVHGYDISDHPWDILNGKEPPMQEEGLQDLLDHGRSIGRAASVGDVVQAADVVFVAVQTPHAPQFGGEQPVTDAPEDFEYSHLVNVCRQVASAALVQKKSVVLVVVSTVLPGTTNRLIRPLLNQYVNLVYSPQFIAMGTTIADFINPEFVICGTDMNLAASYAMEDVFSQVHGNNRLFNCDITTAEAIKVFYNTFLSMKLVWANHVMEMCHKTGANCDRVIDALSLATDRVVSPKYMRGGMGDGGACHPRDLIALSWLEEQLDTSVPLFADLCLARESQTEWLAKLVKHYVHMTGGKQVLILGRSYKPGSDLTAGSPAILLKSYLEDLHPWQYDPHTGTNAPAAFRGDSPMVYVVAAKHPEFAQMDFHPGSVVIDPFGYIPDQGMNVTVVRVGRH